MATQTFLDRVRVTTATTGQGTITMGAAVSPNFFTLAESGVADGAQITIAIEESGNIEISSGIVGGSGTTVTRATVHHSKIAGTPGTSKMELGGAAVVYVVDPAWWMIDIEGRAGFHQKFPEVAPKTADYTVTAADKGVPLIANKATAITFTLPPLAGALNEFYFFRDIGLGTLTLDGNASETIEGATTLAVPTGMAAMVWPNNGNGSWRAQVFGPTSAEIQGVIAKTVPADLDLFGFLDSAASYVLKRFTWANTKTLLLWETITSAAAAKTTPVDADLLSIGDSAAAGVIKKLTWANLKTTLAASTFLRFDAAAGLTAAQMAQARVNISAALRGQIWDLTLSNDPTDAVNDIGIAAGQCASIEGNAVLMVLVSALIKRLDAVWAVGTNQGMRASGAAVATTTYHIFLIRRSDTGVVDVAADTSVIGANLAANTDVAYDQKRRIGSIIWNGSTIVPFLQDGDVFTLKTSVQDVNDTTTGATTTAKTATLSVPIGIRLRARGTVNLTTNTASQNQTLAISDLSAADVIASPQSASLQTQSTAGTYRSNGHWEQYTNTSAQVRWRNGNADANLTTRINTDGWTDTRGRNS